MEIEKWIVSHFGKLIKDTVVSFERLNGGINSVVFHVKTARREYVVKKYLYQEDDLRDRLRTEFGMLSFLWEKGVRNIRQPLLKLDKEKIGVYQYIKGKSFKEEDIQKSDVKKVAKFLKKLSKLSKEKDASKLPMASESAGSMKQYQEILEQRFKKLIHFKNVSLYKAELTEILDILLPLYQRMKHAMQKAYKMKNRQMGVSFPSLTLSPSDIGFSNILKTRDGRLFFYDFEYAGWDDPAKTISDFYLHPGVSLTVKHRELFFVNVVDIADRKDIYNRLGWVYLLLSIKWCVIMLNPFRLSDKVDQKEYGQFAKVKKRLHTIEHDITMRVFPVSLLDASVVI